MRVGKYLCAVALSALATATAAQAAVIVEYSTAGTSGTGGSEPVSLPATTTATGISATSNLVRGPGLDTAALGNGYSADDWTLSSSTEIAQTNGDYFGWGFTVAPGYKASLSTLDLSMRRSAINAPDHFEVYASTDGFTTPGTLVASWTYFGRSSSTAPGTITPYQWMTTDTPGQGNGNPIQTQNLADDALLQDIAGGTTVSFRLYGWGNNAGAAASNTVALGRTVSTTPANSGGPSIGGEITLVPEPATMSTLGVAAAVLLGKRKRR